jgi:hypothetical protein
MANSSVAQIKTSIVTGYLTIRLCMVRPAATLPHDVITTRRVVSSHQFSMLACSSRSSRRKGLEGAKPRGVPRLRRARIFRAPLMQKQNDQRRDPSLRQLNKKPWTLRMGLRTAARKPRRGVHRLHPRARMVDGTDQSCWIGGATTP